MSIHLDEKPVIFARGNPGEKTYKGKKINATPIAYFNEDGMGVGLEFDGRKKYHLHGLFMPQDDCASYRGMKIAEIVRDFDDHTLYTCLYSGRKRSNEQSDEHVKLIEETLGKIYIEMLYGKIPMDKDLKALVNNPFFTKDIFKDATMFKKPEDPRDKDSCLKIDRNMGNVIRNKILALDPNYAKKTEKLLKDQYEQISLMLYE